MTSKTNLFKTIFLGSCALMTVSACAGYEDSFYAYDHPADNYYNSEIANQDKYPMYYNTPKAPKMAMIGNSNQVSRPKTIDVAFSEPAAAPDMIVMEGEAAPVGKFIPAGNEPAMMAGAVAPVPATMSAPVAMAAPKDFMINGCPSFDILPDMRTISFFKGGNTSQLVADATIQEVRGSCTMGNNTLEVNLKMLIEARIGEFGRYQTDPSAEELQSYPYFVALVNKATGDIEFKKIFAAIVRFPANTGVQSEYETINAYVPIPTGQSIDNYALNVGFQLNGEQLNFNRNMMSTATPVAVAPTTPTIAPMGSEQSSFMAAPAPVGSGAAISIEVEGETAMAPAPTQVMPASQQAMVPNYSSASNTSLTSGKRFLRNRPRVSQDPLSDTYGDTQVSY